MWDRAENLEVRRWNRFFNKIHINWLDYWNPDDWTFVPRGGPGGQNECPIWERIQFKGIDRCKQRKGKYIFYVRSIDPAGNVDPTFDTVRYNMLRWDYVQSPPVFVITMSCFGVLLLLFLIYQEYRRRKRKAAMQRYAIKRMRRKFKASQKDAKDGKGGVDWKSMMDDDDEGGGKKKVKFPRERLPADMSTEKQ